MAALTPCRRFGAALLSLGARRQQQHAAAVVAWRFNSTQPATFRATLLTDETTTNPKPKAENKDLVFGKYFSDHMLQVAWSKAGGWQAPAIMPYQNISLPPSALVFHYGLECFEGMKAYRGDDNKIRLFRPDLNAKRLLKSGTRLALPAFDCDELVKCITALVVKDQKWVPQGRGYSAYIRPTYIATQDTLGVSDSDKALLYAIISPVGPYFASGFKPVKLLANNANVRAWPGGIGDTKCGGNYAPTIMPQREATQRGFNQILWLFNGEITEVGTMNLFISWINDEGEQELITPPLDGTILPGVTRQSVLDLARKAGKYKVTEGRVTMDQLVRKFKEGKVLEMFGAGTAATISPIGQITYEAGDNAPSVVLDVPLTVGGNAGPIATEMTQIIFDIQYGKVAHEWAPIIA